MGTFTLDNYSMIYHRIPECEQRMPIAILDGKVYSWDDVFDMIFTDRKVAKRLIDKINLIIDS